jgi:ABC-2 type transport system permease protein
VFYPQPYLGQLVRKIPIAVVDDDRTDLSRRFIQTLDADEAISVAVRAPALDVAQIALAPLSPIELLMEPLCNPTGGQRRWRVSGSSIAARPPE